MQQNVVNCLFSTVTKETTVRELPTSFSFISMLNSWAGLISNMELVHKNSFVHSLGHKFFVSPFFFVHAFTLYTSGLALGLPVSLLMNLCFLPIKKN